MTVRLPRPLAAGAAALALALAAPAPASAGHGDTVGSTGRLYDAYFLRDPEPAGWCYWIEQHDRGLPMGSIADYFATSPEFVATYGPLDLPQFVRRVYLNVFDREPDPGGYTHWATALAEGRISRGGVMLSFSESPEFVATRPLPPGPTCAPATPAAPSRVPAVPADVDCPDFPTQAAAQAWFDTYYPHYGDVARLDADHDLRACEALP